MSLFNRCPKCPKCGTKMQYKLIVGATAVEWICPLCYLLKRAKRKASK